MGRNNSAASDAAAATPSFVRVVHRLSVLEMKSLVASICGKIIIKTT